MKLFYFTSQSDNFGDELNARLWARVAPGYEESTRADWLVGIGTILDERLLALEGRLLIMGSGFRPQGWRPEILNNWKIGFVRGPLTAKVLDLGEHLALSDPALLVPRYFETDVESSGEIGFMPHYHTFQRMDCARACEEAGVTLIPPNGDVDETVRIIASMDRVIVEAMHGGIVADVLGVPWLRVKALSWKFETERVSEYKWADWAMSMGLDHGTRFQADIPCWRSRGASLVNALLARIQIRKLAATIRSAADSAKFQLSKESHRRSISDRMDDRVRELL